MYFISFFILPSVDFCLNPFLFFKKIQNYFFNKKLINNIKNLKLIINIIIKN
jgi:hypothetical protein